MTTTADLQKMMTRVRNLLTKADDAGVTEEESALFRAKAEELMTKYRIAEEGLIATDAMAVTPVIRDFMFTTPGNRFMTDYVSILSSIAAHAGIKLVWGYESGDGTAERPRGYYAHLIGYDGDVRLAEWLWASAALVFRAHLEPSYDATVSDQVNAYRMRAAGWLRKDIAEAIWGDNTPALRSRAQRAYEAECVARGERAAKSMDAKAYQRAYAEEFDMRLWRRLRNARDAADSVGGAMVFHGREERVLEAMYQAFPHLRPSTDVAPPREIKPPKPETKSQRMKRMREDARRNSLSARIGGAAGSAAADTVSLDRTSTTAQRVERAPMTVGELLG